MKIQTLCFLIIVLCFTACDESKTSERKFTFHISGNVTGGEGEQLALWIHDSNLDERLVTTVKDGKFEFTGTLDHPEKATLVCEREFTHHDGSRFNYNLFLDREPIRLSARLITDSDNPHFEDDTITSSTINQHYRETIDKFYVSFEGVMFKTLDSVYMDSLRRNVLPARRSAALDLYDAYYSAGAFPLVSASVLRMILDKNMFFQKDDLSVPEKERLTQFFHQIDTSVSRSTDYKVVSLLVDKMNARSESPVFRDFVLRNIDGTSTRLSDVVRKNKLTVIDFWWFGCGPCRKFNVDARADYALLRSNGIEIVGISTDPGMKQWKEASATDSVQWVNLYAGEKSPIEIAYDVTYAPFKVVVDSQFNILDVDVKKITELIPIAQAMK